MQITKAQILSFRKKLLQWFHHEHYRPLPWKEDKDPYKIWLSEIILQQTRVAQGMPYYQSFVAQYPTVKDLAEAKDEEVFKLWQGLGYYNRCKNLLFTARHIQENSNGIFPNHFVGLLSLKGVGHYTAAAIASFAFDEAVAVVDGNVFRVLSRFLGIETPIDSTEGKKTFQNIAQQLLDPKNSSDYNQAIMDLGAVICTPQQAKCNTCPLYTNCVARQRQLQNLLPVKEKKLVVKERHFHYIIYRYQNTIAMRKRSINDIWQNLFEPYLIETSKSISKPTLAKKISVPVTSIKHLETHSQRLTHQLIHFYFYEQTLNLKERKAAEKEGYIFYNHAQMQALPMPKTIHSFFIKNKYL